MRKQRVMYLAYIAALFGIVLLLSAPLLGQTYSIYVPGLVQTPQIHLGIAGEPSVIAIPPVIAVQPGLPIGPPLGDFEPQPEPEMFDYLVDPSGALFPGSMADASISLGEYARELRAHKGEGPPPIHMEVKPE